MPCFAKLENGNAALKDRVGRFTPAKHFDK